MDQTNHSVVVGESVVVKWLTPPAPLPHPAVDVFPHLVAAGFDGTAPPYAAVTAVLGGREHLLALVTGYLPEARDGWEWCVDAAESGTTDFATPLAHLMADLHLALSTYSPAPTAAPSLTTDGSTTPHPRRTEPPTAGVARVGGCGEGASGVGGAWERAEGALGEALELTGGEDGVWLAARADALRRELAPLAAPISTPLIRIHGDLHIGQVLKWRDGYAVIDFDGNPTVADTDLFQPAARDVAQLATSLDHVAQVAVKRRGVPPRKAAAWARAARAGLLAAYRDRLAQGGRPDLLDETLLRPFEVEQECRELIYAARHLPRWRYAPMGVLRTWYPEEETA
ncbi:hypothetical protein [Nonomuraea maritima]|uniref:hypothetical protein n=1 Tax=Nonomuraea maritima TaxID=683260 RepID=UPI00370FF4FF